MEHCERDLYVLKDSPLLARYIIYYIYSYIYLRIVEGERSGECASRVSKHQPKKHSLLRNHGSMQQMQHGSLFFGDNLVLT